MCFCYCYYVFVFFFFFNDTATTEIYTLSLHDALPISVTRELAPGLPAVLADQEKLIQSFMALMLNAMDADRKSTRLNSSHSQISYAVFCLKKKKKKNNTLETNDRKEKVYATIEKRGKS